MDTRQVETKSEEHSNFITDIRFKPNSTQLATSSSDGTVRLWNAADVRLSFPLFADRSTCFHVYTFFNKSPRSNLIFRLLCFALFEYLLSDSQANHTRLIICLHNICSKIIKLFSFYMQDCFWSF